MLCARHLWVMQPAFWLDGEREYEKGQLVSRVTKAKQTRASSAVLLQPLDNPIDLRDMVTFRLLRIAAKLTQGFIQSYTTQFGIGLPEWRTLGMLGQFGPLPSIRIAELAEMDRGSISRAVAWLEERGMVRRMDDPGHQRRKIVAMTEVGKSLHDRIGAHALERQRRILASLGDDEKSVLNHMLGKIDTWAAELHAGVEQKKTPEEVVQSREAFALPSMASGAVGREQLLEQVAQLKRAIEIYA